MDEDEVNLDDTEIWDPPALPEVTHEAAEVSDLPEAAPEALDPETAFEDAEFEAPEVDEVPRDDAEFEAPETTELAEVTPEAPANDFAHDEPVLETQSAEDLPGMSFEAEEIPEYLDDVETEVADVAEMETVGFDAPELDESIPEIEFAADVVDGALGDPDLSSPEVTTTFESPKFAVDDFPRQFPGPGWRTRGTYWMG